MGGGSQPATSTLPATTAPTKPVDSDRSTGSKVKEMAHGVKGLFAAVHGAGENVRGSFNAGVDRTFNEVLNPHPIPFPSLRPLGEFAEDGEFPAEVFTPTKFRCLDYGRGDVGGGGEKGRYSWRRRFRVKVEAG
jgi:hypothetical protein